MIWAIVLAAGRGSRFGPSPKQYELLGGRSMVSWAVDAAGSTSDGVVLVVPPGTDDVAADPGVAVMVAGGATRSESVRAGLSVIPGDAELIVVHDAARPLAPPSLFESVLRAVDEGADGAVPGLAVADTVKRVHGSTVVETVDRTELVAVQTPQAFRAGVLRRAHEGQPSATDDAALVERIGGRVVVVDGDPRAFKITFADDLARAEAFL